jgi:hypothetical protein
MCNFLKPWQKCKIQFQSEGILFLAFGPDGPAGQSACAAHVAQLAHLGGYALSSSPSSANRPTVHPTFNTPPLLRLPASPVPGNVRLLMTSNSPP